MKILYLSCHETLEADELKVLDRLGHQVFSIGHYVDPRKPLHPTKEGGLDIKFDEELLERFKALHNYKAYTEKLDGLTINDVIGAYYFRVKKEFAQLFDLFVIAHFEENLTLNWDSFKGKPVILRCIGQPQTHFSPYANKAKIAAYSPTERYISRHHDADAIIRPFVDTNYYSNWNGDGDYVLTINKWMKKRGEYSAWETYLQVTNGINRVVAGFENEDIEFAKPDLKPDEIQQLRREALVYFSTCTKPGPFTYSFMEALSTGIPMVSVGPKIGNVRPNVPTFEAHKFIENGISGFWSDSIPELRSCIMTLMTDKKLAKQISENGRKAALQHFSMERNMKDWKEFLEKV